MYTLLTLFILGLAGVFLHSLVEMDKLNRASAGNINLKQYLKMEVFSIMISIIVVAIAVFCSHEIKVLANAGKFLGVGIVTIGYMGQSVLVYFMGKASSKITNDKQ